VHVWCALFNVTRARRLERAAIPGIISHRLPADVRKGLRGRIPANADVVKHAVGKIEAGMAEWRSRG
jgi:hypothetical protein